MNPVERRHRTVTRRVLPAVCLLLLAAVLPLASRPASAATTGRMLGVNRAATEYQCVHGAGIFDGPTDAASVTAMKSWHINTVRVPLNEDCWLGINGVNPAYSGGNYQSAVAAYVRQLAGAGLTVIVDLHWNAPGTAQATGQQVMADADHSPAFWSSVAETFKNDPKVVYDLYNEPHDISWGCWLNGCSSPAGWQTAGMQQLLNAVRGTGAQQAVIATGLAYGNDLSQWLQNRPSDPAGRLDAGFHVYGEANGTGFQNACVTTACWDSTVGQVAKQVPVLTGELGEEDCTTGFINRYMAWADSNNVSYLGWAWNTHDCSGFPSLISDYNGTPTAFGVGLRDHLVALDTTAPTPARVRNDYEDGTVQGWAGEYNNATTGNTSLVALSGARALEINVPAGQYGGVGTRTGLAGLASGQTVTYHVYQPSALGPVTVTPYVQRNGGDYATLKTAPVALQPGWNTVTWTVPTVDSILVLGLQVDNPTGHGLQIALDDVTW